MPLMQNLDRKEWEFTQGEKYAIEWLEEHGFDVILEKRYISKDIFRVSKDGLTDKFQLPLGNHKINYCGVMDQFDKHWALLSALTEREANEPSLHM